MWRKNGMKLTGWYGIWRGREVELSWEGVHDGNFSLIHHGNVSPEPGWEKDDSYFSFGYPQSRYLLDVPENEVSDVQAIEVRGTVGRVRVRVVGENEKGELAIESDVHTPPNYRDDLAQKYGLEYYDDRRAFAFGWVPAEDVHDITTERREITP
jgi:hypothetical protein